MSVFEFTFGLNAVILGLALAEMAMRLQVLVFAGRRVRWAPEPVLLAAIVFLVIVVVWLGAWRGHAERETTIGAVLLQLLSIIAPFMVAVAVFPRVDDPDEAVDLYAYYDRRRLFLFGGLLVARLISLGYVLIAGAMPMYGAASWAPWLASLIPYAALMFVRWRWFNIVGLLLVLVAFGASIAAVRITD